MHNDKYLWRHSVEVILKNQQPSGAYLACPTMPDYQLSWFRDGAYIAYALTVDGADVSIMYGESMAAQWKSVEKFHNWCAGVITDQAEQLERSIARAERAEAPVLADTLNARYCADGQAGQDEWPEFQLDGPGTWLWSLMAFVEIARFRRPLPAKWVHAIDLTARYLAALWQTPCYDCWEENGDDIHISTLGAIYAGLGAAERMLPNLDFSASRQAIRDFVLNKGLTPGGELAKSVGLDMVDANLLSVAVPHGLLAPDDPIMKKTVARIARELHAPGRGVHRHLRDVYYGGGEWVLLALWLAWYYIEADDILHARELLEWSTRQADTEGNLPEQVNTVMLAPNFYERWVAKRGAIANPLLWTHAKYLILRQAIAGTDLFHLSPLR